MIRELGEVKAEAEATIPPLVGGILEDAQTLFRQEVALAKSEIKIELVTAKKAAIGFSLSAAVGAMAALLLSLAVVHLLNLAGLPLWASYGVVGLLYGVAAAVSFSKGKQSLAETDMVPQTIQSMKENVKWIAGT